MTDRTNHLTVILDSQYRDDDAEAIIDAIKMIKGVVSVKLNVTDPKQYIAISTAKTEIRSKLFDLLND